jgi:hypothetical protein
LAAQPLTDRTGPERLPGLALNRDSAAGEATEKEIDAFISKRHRDRIATEGERQAEESWKVSERAYFARRREENRLAWCDYSARLAGALRARAEEYDQRAARLEDRGRGGA